MTGNDALVLGAEFPPAGREDWLQLVDETLRGASFEAKLVHTTADAIAIQPLYTADDVDTSDDPAGVPGLAPFVRGARAAGGVDGGWDVRQRHLLLDPAPTNTAILTDLERGVTSILLTITAPTGAAELHAALDGVLFDLAPIALDAGPHSPAAIDALVEVWDRRGVPAGAVLGALRADPLGVLARHGQLDSDLDAAFARLARLVEAMADRPGVTALAVDASPYADAGASEAQELACSLSTAVAYLRALTDAGIDVDTACRHLEFTYVATADQFATVAKLRAARRLWARVAEVCGAGEAASAQHQHVVTAGSMLTRRDPWVNLLRTTIACFAAGVAGADAVTVAPFDAAVGVSDDFGRRLARNTQLLLVHESNLARVIDPAGGAWYVESLTDEIARAAWARFQAIEAAGGMAEALRSGTMAADIDAVWAERATAIARRRRAITGVSEFPDLDERPVHRPVPPDPVPLADPATVVTALPRRRDADGFEALRDAAEAAAAAGQPPIVFLANLGPLATHTARATFARNCFEAGGIRAVGTEGFDDAAAVADAFTASGARLAVICSSDALYEQLAAPVAAALKAAGAEAVFLAGNPGEHRDEWRAAGIDEFVHLGSDVLAVLEEAHRRLGTTGEGGDPR